MHKLLPDLCSSIRLSHLVTEVSSSHHDDFVNVEGESIATDATYVAPTLDVGEDDIALRGVDGIIIRICHSQCTPEPAFMHWIGESESFTNKAQHHKQLNVNAGHS